MSNGRWAVGSEHFASSLPDSRSRRASAEPNRRDRLSIAPTPQHRQRNSWSCHPARFLARPRRPTCRLRGRIHGRGVDGGLAPVWQAGDDCDALKRSDPAVEVVLEHRSLAVQGARLTAQNAKGIRGGLHLALQARSARLRTAMGLAVPRCRQLAASRRSASSRPASGRAPDSGLYCNTVLTPARQGWPSRADS